MDLSIRERNDAGICEREIITALKASLEGRNLKRVILVPPDYTRLNSKAGFITRVYYRLLRERGCQVDVMPALGSHMAMTREECSEMFGPEISFEDILVHDYKRDCVRLGAIEGEFVDKVTEGQFSSSIPVELNRRFLECEYDLILSIGQVVPHEELGFSSYSKNLLVGCGGYQMISQTHLLGAVYGMERILAKIENPVREIFDQAYQRYVKQLPVLFVMTVTTASQQNVRVHGLFIGETRKAFEDAAALSAQVNVHYLQKPIKKALVYVEPKEFKTSWLANKALYRMRLAMAAGGELIVLAPGMYQFGETKENDRLIRKYGYQGKQRIWSLYQRERELKENLPVTFHLMHGSVDENFSLIYAVKKLKKEDIEQVGYHYDDFDQVIKRYHIEDLRTGWNIAEDGEEVFYVENPALGLWIYRET